MPPLTLTVYRRVIREVIRPSWPNVDLFERVVRVAVASPSECALPTKTGLDHQCEPPERCPQTLEVSIIELVRLGRNDDEVWLPLGDGGKVDLGVVRFQFRANIVMPIASRRRDPNVSLPIDIHGRRQMGRMLAG